ncbi:MAG: hypothetical protein ABGW77_03990 [Campylobacterales bacterium]
MKKILASVGIAVGLLFGGDLGECLVNHTTNADKVLLVKWIVGSYAHHPALKGMIKVDETQFQKSEKDVAKLFERLIGKDCKEEFNVAFQRKGEMAVAEAFGMLGKVAGVEVSNNPYVRKNLDAFTKYISPTFLSSLAR